MSNQLCISVTKFTILGEYVSTFGFTASDDHASAYENHYNSSEEFFVNFPTDDALIKYVLSLDEFQDIYVSDSNDMIGVSAIIVYGY